MIDISWHFCTDDHDVRSSVAGVVCAIVPAFSTLTCAWEK